MQVDSWGYDAICVSAESGLGLDALTETLSSCVSVTAGPSGVGKSSLINALNAARSSNTAQLEESEVLCGEANGGENPCEGEEGGGWKDGVILDGGKLPSRHLEKSDSAKEACSGSTDTNRWQGGTLENGGTAASEGNGGPHAPSEQVPEQRGGMILTASDATRHVADGHSGNGSTVQILDRPPATSSSAAEADDSLQQNSSEAEVSGLRFEGELGFQAVGEVSQIGRGRHTTRTVTLLPVAGGLLADTPGFNQPTLEGLPPEDLPRYFPEIQERIGE